jgi:7-carboxy-7-deazaguanine synthase
MLYQVAERFKSIQGEGLYAGVPMAFIRFVGCSVGKRICQHCDTDFEKTYPWLGGGEYTETELLAWARPYEHICLTGGEPLDQDLVPLILGAARDQQFHVETSGTVHPAYLRTSIDFVHICVSPKPGFLESMLSIADEIKVIVPGLGINPPEGSYWMELEEARYWARRKPVFLQPRNGKWEIEMNNLRLCEELVGLYPELRLSVQMHKLLKVR